MTDATPFSAEPLLHHARGLRALARALVRDSHLADDLVQTTWLRALQARPAADGASGKGPMPWLARVLRNEAWTARRAARRARAREDGLPPRESEPPAGDVAARLAVQRAVLDAVDALPPGQRDAVYLRWFEELPPRVIARRLGVSTRAVESRLRRAVQELRRRLDAHRPEGRAAWLPALTAVAWPRSGTIPLVAGALALQIKVAVAVVALALGALYWLGSDSAPPERAIDSNRAESATADPQSAPPPERTAASAPRSPVPEPPAANAPPALLHGTVLDPDGRATAGIAVRFSPDYRGATLAPAARAPGALTCRSAADGSFEMPDPAANGKIDCCEPGWTTVLGAERSFDGEPVVVVVAPSRVVAGAVQLADGTPMADAAVELVLPDDLRARFDVSLHHSEDRDWQTHTDELGRFAFEAPPAIAGCEVVATAQGHAPGSVAIDERDHAELRIVVRPLAAELRALRGVVLDAAGRPVAGASVALGNTPSTTAEDGTFEFVLSEPDDERRLFAVALGWRPAVVERAQQPGGQWPDFVELRLVDRPLAIAGTVLRADGQPHANAGVWIDDPTYFASSGERSFSAEHVMHRDELLWRKFATNDAGRFRIEGLLDREYEVRAVDMETTDMTVLPGVRAGSSGVTLRFSPDAVYEQVAGRVVDSAGAPVAGVSLRVTRATFVFGKPPAQRWVCEARGAHAVSGADGRFVLENVPRRGIVLELHGENLITDDYEFPEGVVTPHVEIVVTRRCGLRIDVSGSPLAEAEFARVLDGRGQPLAFHRESASTRYIERKTALAAGRTEVVYVPDTARTIVLTGERGELGRLPVAPNPEEVTVVRP